VQSCGDGPDLDSERVAYRAVIKVEVEAEEQHFALPHRQLPHKLSQSVIHYGQCSGRLVTFIERRGNDLGTRDVVSGVHHASSNPRIERPAATKRSACPDCSRKPLLNRVACRLTIAGNRQREPEEVPTPIAIDPLYRIGCRTIAHRINDSREAPFV
jgi:hypothetical protein